MQLRLDDKSQLLARTAGQTRVGAHMTTRLLIASAILTASAHAAVELTSVKDWKKQVKGKNAFVKFLAPW